MSEVPNQSPSRREVFDTTLRDGAQTPGIFLSYEDKVAIAMQLAEVGVDVLEAGFPSSSPQNFEATRTIAETVDGPVICAFSGYKDRDIETTWEAIEPAKHSSRGARLNICLAVSDLHMSKRFEMTREEALSTAVNAVKRARGFTDDVEFSAEDASRANRGFLKDIVSAVAYAGATTIMIPDTVGMALPDEYAQLTQEMRDELNARGFDDVVIAAHCHNDMGLAAANTLAALIDGGAGQLDVTAGGIGERAGNTSLEQMAAIALERPELGITTGIDTRRLTGLVRDIARRGDVRLQHNLPVVGKNAFRHASGWHQHGMTRDRRTFEHMDPERYGNSSELVLSDQSGRAGIKNNLEAMAITPDPGTLLALRQNVENLAVHEGRFAVDSDLEEWHAELTGEVLVDEFHLDLDELVETTVKGVSTVTLAVNGTEAAASSPKGPVDAARIAINEAIGTPDGNLEGWHGDAPSPDSGSAVDIDTKVYLGDSYEVQVHARERSANFASIAAYMKGQNMIRRIQKRVEENSTLQTASVG